MNYTEIKTKLSKFPEPEIDRYINYLKFLSTDKNRDGKLNNTWFQYFKETQAIDIFSKVAIDGLSIDGETITLQFKGKVMVSYNYQAYKNRVLHIYPETKFDMQLVNKGDKFKFVKESGNVQYSHEIIDPFNPNPEIIGVYCIIKNKRGEFLETLNITEINKMKNVAKLKNIWDAWFGEMCLKSVIKRACKRHFRDITANIDKIDNETVDLDSVNIDNDIQKKIKDAKTINELSLIYNEYYQNSKDKINLGRLLTERKNEIQKTLPKITKEDFPKAVEMLKSGKKTGALLDIWQIDYDTQQDLISKSLI